MAQRLGDIFRAPACVGICANRGCYNRDVVGLARAVGITGVARRFKKQIFLSIDMPPTLGSMGQEGKLLLAIERAVVDTVKSHEMA